MPAELFQLLFLIIIANGAPIIIRQLLNNKFNFPIDSGITLPDSNPVFGPSKTWRGVTAALLLTSIVSLLIGYTLEAGFLVAAYAICGDLFSSFIKRRLRMKSSSMAPLLDQIPESLIPAYMMREVFNLGLLSVIWLVLIFIIVELLLSHILYRWGVRKKPY